MPYLAFIDDDLQLVTNDFSEAKASLGVELVNWMTFSNKKNHILIEIEDRTDKKFRIVDTFSDFTLNDLGFGCGKWAE